MTKRRIKTFIRFSIKNAENITNEFVKNRKEDKTLIENMEKAVSLMKDAASIEIVPGDSECKIRLLELMGEADTCLAASFQRVDKLSVLDFLGLMFDPTILLGELAACVGVFIQDLQSSTIEEDLRL